MPVWQVMHSDIGVAGSSHKALQRSGSMYSRFVLGSAESIISGVQAPGASAPAAGGGNRAGAADGSADVLAEVTFDGGFRLPGSIYNRLFDYQKTGTQPPRLLCMAGDLHRMALTLLLQSRLRAVPSGFLACTAVSWQHCLWHLSTFASP